MKAKSEQRDSKWVYLIYFLIGVILLAALYLLVKSEIYIFKIHGTWMGIVLSLLLILCCCLALPIFVFFIDLYDISTAIKKKKGTENSKREKGFLIEGSLISFFYHPKLGQRKLLWGYNAGFLILIMAIGLKALIMCYVFISPGEFFGTGLNDIL